MILSRTQAAYIPVLSKHQGFDSDEKEGDEARRNVGNGAHSRISYTIVKTRAQPVRRVKVSDS